MSNEEIKGCIENISGEELSSLPIRHFEGEIVVVSDLSQVDAAVEELKKEAVLGFDTETKPSFRKGQMHKVALLQLSTPEKAFLFRLNYFKQPESLLSLLADPKITKAGAAIRDDIKGLCSNAQFEPAGFIELQDIAKDLGIMCFSLKKMSAIVLGYRISKAQQLSNWEADVLNESQLRYAATDAWVSLEIYNAFNNGWKL